MQAKISTFFKPSNSKTRNPPQLSDQIKTWDLSGKKNSETLVTYRRLNLKHNSKSIVDDEIQLGNKEMGKINDGSVDSLLIRSDSVGKILNKKRSCSQYHLELGQSDFLLHTCSVCGLMYARGDEVDEKMHKAFHKTYNQGIQFKGWQNERVVSVPSDNGDRIILVLDGDPPVKKPKIQEVVKVMERELGFSDGWLLHKLCKVYLFISSHRIVGCLIAEPIKTAHRVIASSISCKNSDDKCANRPKSVLPKPIASNASMKRPSPTALQFGNFTFQREVIKRGSTNTHKVNQWDSGAILCEEEAVPAFCGIRAIWVAPSSRRKGIATHLVDSARKSFCTDHVLQHSLCAFSSPTYSGKAFTSAYSGTRSFLVYRTQDC